MKACHNDADSAEANRQLLQLFGREARYFCFVKFPDGPNVFCNIMDKKKTAEILKRIAFALDMGELNPTVVNLEEKAP